MYTSGSTQGTTAVALAKDLVNASMVCEVEDEYVVVVWFEYYNFTSASMVSNLQNLYRLLQNGHNLQILDMNLEKFLLSHFECHILTDPRSGGSIPAANFTTVAISGRLCTNHFELTLTLRV